MLEVGQVEYLYYVYVTRLDTKSIKVQPRTTVHIGNLRAEWRITKQNGHDATAAKSDSVLLYSCTPDLTL